MSINKSVLDCLNQIVGTAKAHLAQCSVSPDSISARMVPSQTELTTGAISQALLVIDESEFDREFEFLLAKYAPADAVAGAPSPRMTM